MDDAQRSPGAPPGNQNARVIHGGEGAIKRLGAGLEYVGLAHEVELAVIAELETDGRAAIVTRNARRLQAACDLFWNAVTKAAQDGDLEKLDRYVARFGWLAQAALRAWAQVKQEQRDADDGHAETKAIIDRYQETVTDGRQDH